MSYRLKLIITISVLIAITFSLGGTILITASFNHSLEAETAASLNSFQTVLNTLYLLNSMEAQTGFDNLAQTLSRMEAQHVGHWQALSLKAGDTVIYQSRSELLGSYALPALSPDQCSYMRISDGYGQGLLTLSTIVAG